LTTCDDQNNIEKINSPLFYEQSINKVKQANKKLSSKKEGSNNYKKAKLHYARVHKKVKNQRKDHHFKLAMQLIRKYDTLLFETLDIDSMKEEHGKKINDMGFANFIKILEYYCKKYKREIHHINKWYASTKTCNVCQYKNDALTIHDREWDCPQCGNHHDRDPNAAKNILKQGLLELMEIKKKLEKFAVGTSTDRLEDVSPELKATQVATAMAFFA
jgi:putative transposase